MPLPCVGVEEGGEELFEPASTLVNTSMALTIGGRVEPLADAIVTLIAGPTTVIGYRVITLHSPSLSVVVDFF